MSRHLHLTSIPGMNQLFPVHENCISAIRSPYKDLQVSKCTSSFHPIPASLALRSPNSCNLPHLCTASSVSRSLDSNLTSNHVTPYLQPGPEFGVSTEQRTRSVSSGLSKQLGHMPRIRSKQSIHQMGRFAHLSVTLLTQYFSLPLFPVRSDPSKKAVTNDQSRKGNLFDFFACRRS